MVLPARVSHMHSLLERMHQLACEQSCGLRVPITVRARRCRLVWNRIWAVLSDFFVEVGCHRNLQARPGQVRAPPATPRSGGAGARLPKPRRAAAGRAARLVSARALRPVGRRAAQRGAPAQRPAACAATASRPAHASHPLLRAASPCADRPAAAPPGACNARQCVVDAARHNPTLPQVAMYAVDSLRQLAMKFLERDELANYSFQNDFLKPFVIVMRLSRALEIRELIIRCAAARAARRPRPLPARGPRRLGLRLCGGRARSSIP